jgi:hypothetical protein
MSFSFHFTFVLFLIRRFPNLRRLLDELNKDHRGSEFVKRPGSYIDLLHPKLEFLKQVNQDSESDFQERTWANFW